VPVVGVTGWGKRADAGPRHVVQPLGVGHALRMCRDHVTSASGVEPLAEDGNIVLPPESYPPLEELRRRASRAS
jgi:hypothetical protein